MISADLMHLILREFAEARELYPSLKLLELETGFIVSGTIDINRCHTDGRIISDEYSIKINISDQYPHVLPIASEDEKISKDYHRLQGGGLCLGTPFEQWLVFSKNNSLNGFIEFMLIPYLFRYSYFMEYGVYPYGDRAHGSQGILNAYNERYGIASKKELISLLEYWVAVGSSLQKRRTCPCGSKKRIFRCLRHYELFLDMLMHKVPQCIIQDELQSLNLDMKWYPGSMS